MGPEIAKGATSRTAPGDNTLRDAVAETPQQQAAALAVWGEPVVGWDLALLLRGPRYDTRFVPITPTGEVAWPEGVQRLLLAPIHDLSVERRQALLVALKEAAAVASVPLLELLAFPDRVERRHAQMPGPCSAEQLERCIEAALLARPCEENLRDGSLTCSPTAVLKMVERWAGSRSGRRTLSRPRA
jgi:hypothetical protein